MFYEVGNGGGGGKGGSCVVNIPMQSLNTCPVQSTSSKTAIWQFKVSVNEEGACSVTAIYAPKLETYGYTANSGDTGTCQSVIYANPTVSAWTPSN